MSLSPVAVARGRKIVTLIAAGALTVGFVGAVGAAAPDDVIKACVNKTTKAVRISIYASPSWCESNEAYKEWNVQGVRGPQGPVGPVGPDGADGANGMDGANGADGMDGAKGMDGADGANGDDGMDGADGANGADGMDGADGADGANGKDGADGAPGPEGPAGPAGPEGPAGPAGADGADGVDGADGWEPASQVVSDAVTLSSNSTVYTVSVSCPLGEVMLGGGHQLTSASVDTRNSFSYPSDGNTWRASVRTKSGPSGELVVYALCTDTD